MSPFFIFNGRGKEESTKNTHLEKGNKGERQILVLESWSVRIIISP